MAAWKDDETLKFIELWSEDNIQAELEGCRRNREVYEKIVSRTKEAGYDRSIDQCRIKIKKLKQDYRKIKDKHGETGEERKSWCFYEAVDSILGVKPTTRPPVVVDTLADDDKPTEEDEERSKLMEKGQVHVATQKIVQRNIVKHQ